MQFALTPEQISFRDSARALLDRECTPAVVRRAWSADDGRVPGLWKRLADLGLFGALAPEQDGGLGLGELDLVVLLEECGRFAVPGPLAETAAVAVPLLRDLSGDSRREWVRSVAAGDVSVAVGLGSSPLVEGAATADLLVLEHAGELHVVEGRAVRTDAQQSFDGARRLCEVKWSPSPATCIARGAVAGRAIDDAKDRGAVATAALLLGLGRRMLGVTVEYAKTRQQFGRPIGSFQAVKHHLADAMVSLEMAAPAVYRAGHSLALRAPDARVHASTAKALASDAATTVARKALQCHGAIGYAFENDLHMWMKRAWALAAAWGDAATHRARVAAVVLARAGGV